MATIAEPVVERKPTGTVGGRNPLDSLLAVRTIAMNAGDLSRAVMQEVTRIMKQHGNGQVKSVQLGIGRLQEDGHVSAEEAQQLKTIANLVFGATREKSETSHAANQVRQLYQSMVISGKANPVALAIASAASASLSDSQGQTPVAKALAVSGTPGTTGVGAVVGGVIGGVIGGIVGGGLGAGLGAAIGAAAGAAIGYCNQHGV